MLDLHVASATAASTLALDFLVAMASTSPRPLVCSYLLVGIVGGGTIGTIIARDSASCGFSSVVLEKDPRKAVETMFAVVLVVVLLLLILTY